MIAPLRGSHSLAPRVPHLAIKFSNAPAPTQVRYKIVDKIVDVVGVQPQMVNQKYTWKLNVLVEYNECMVTLRAKTLKWKPTNTPNSSTPSTIHNIEPEGTSPSKRLHSECIITCSNKCLLARIPQQSVTIPTTTTDLRTLHPVRLSTFRVVHKKCFNKSDKLYTVSSSADSTATVNYTHNNILEDTLLGKISYIRVYTMCSNNPYDLYILCLLAHTLQ